MQNSLCKRLFAVVASPAWTNAPSSLPTPPASRPSVTPCGCGCSGCCASRDPATATTLATRLGLNTGATSYHLRQLAQHGFIVEDAERGNARDRWWRAAHQSTHTGKTPAGSEEAEAYEAYSQALAVFYSEQLHNAVAERTSLPDDGCTPRP